MSFIPAPLPDNEINRLKAVENTGVLDVVNEELYDVYTQLARKITKCPNSWANVIDKKRQFNLVVDGDNINDKIKKTLRQIDRNETFCQYALRQSDPLIVNDLTKSDIFKDHPSVKKINGVKFYAAFPIINSEGYVLGSLCVEDFKVRKLSKEVVNLMRDLARKLSHQLDIQTHQRHLTIEKVVNVLSNLKQSFPKISLNEAMIILKCFSKLPTSKDETKKLIKLDIINNQLSLTNNSRKIIKNLDLDAKVLKRINSVNTKKNLEKMFNELI